MSVSVKAQLRRELRARRRALSPEYRASAALALVQMCDRHRLWRLGRRWAFYLPFGAELDCQPLMAAALGRSRQVFLPRVLRLGTRRLVFTRLDQVRRWRRSRLGMLEPVAGPFVSVRRLDVVCLPLLGFDAAGGRLGQGGGFYDATLASRRLGSHKPRLIGLAYACQQVEQLPMEPWDVRLDMVLTEKEFWQCATG